MAMLLLLLLPYKLPGLLVAVVERPKWIKCNLV